MQRVENVYKVDDESSGFFLFSEKELMIEYITKYICNMTEVLRGNASKFKMYDFFQTVYLCCEKSIKEIIQSAVKKLNKKADKCKKEAADEAKKYIDAVEANSEKLEELIAAEKVFRTKAKGIMNNLETILNGLSLFLRFMYYIHHDVEKAGTLICDLVKSLLITFMESKGKEMFVYTDIELGKIKTRIKKRLEEVNLQPTSITIKEVKALMVEKKYKAFKDKVIKTFIHGFLHLLGFDHMKQSDYKKMLKEEQNIYHSVIKKIN